MNKGIRRSYEHHTVIAIPEESHYMEDGPDKRWSDARQ